VNRVIRAAAPIVDDEIVVVGSKAVLAEYPDASDSLLRSQELDMFPRHQPERAGEIDAAIGDRSQFHATFGYYAHGVGPDTAVAPAGWEERLVRVDVATVTRGMRFATAWCLEIHDLVLAKLAAGASMIAYSSTKQSVRDWWTSTNFGCARIQCPAIMRMRPRDKWRRYSPA
jgi:hypothetical protein